MKLIISPEVSIDDIKPEEVQTAAILASEVISRCGLKETPTVIAKGEIRKSKKSCRSERFPNQLRPYLVNEDDSILSMKKSGKSFSHISKQMGRTKQAISSRYYLLKRQNGNGEVVA